MLTVLIHRVTVLDHNDELAFTLGILIFAVTFVNHDVTMNELSRLIKSLIYAIIQNENGQQGYNDT